MTNVQTLLRHAELDAEKISAIIRVILFLSLGLMIVSSFDARGASIGAGIAMATYGLGAVVGLFLAWRRIFHPVIPYLFVTFDVILVAIQVLLLARMMGMQAASIFALPAENLIFIILIQASMRYRPWLVVYAATLFMFSLELGPFVLPANHQEVMGGGMASITPGSMAGMVHYQVLPLTLIALAAFILFVISRRTTALLLTSLQHVSRMTTLSRYFSPNLAERLADADDDHILAGRRQPAAVLFVDIRGFTALGETMAPDELGAFLTEYRTRLTQPVFSHGGTVDKFIGDAIMAVFGTPLQRPDDAGRAVQCALAILDAATRWSSERERAGRPPVAIGIGVHYGEVFAGALGGEQLLEYTVIGDTVNVAERLEGLSRVVGSPLVVSAELLQAAGEVGESAKWRRLPPQELKGHSKPVETFCLA